MPSGRSSPSSPAAVAAWPGVSAESYQSASTRASTSARPNPIGSRPSRSAWPSGRIVRYPRGSGQIQATRCVRTGISPFRSRDFRSRPGTSGSRPRRSIATPAEFLHPDRYRCRESPRLRIPGSSQDPLDQRLSLSFRAVRSSPEHWRVGIAQRRGRYNSEFSGPAASREQVPSDQ